MPEELESELLLEAIIPERTKRRRQKKVDDENQERQGLKMITPDQILSTLSTIKSRK